MSAVPKNTASLHPEKLWTPSSPEISRLWDFMERIGRKTGKKFENYETIHGWSISNPEDFWSEVWDFCGVIGGKGERIIERTKDIPWARFFPDAEISYAENMLARAAEAPREPAIIARHQNGPDRVLTWQALYEAVSVWEQALAGAGVGEGDRVAVYLPNIPEAVVILLAASNLGAVFSSAGMEMGPDDLISRFSQVRPKILVTADGYIHGEKEISRRAVIERTREEIDSLECVVVLPLLSGKTVNEFTETYTPRRIEFARRNFSHPLYILFSSGSTGKPKCFEHSAGGAMLKHLCEYALNCDIGKGDRLFYHATPSWMMWNWLAGALGVGATILLYDGSPAWPDAYAQWDFTAAHDCTHHGTAAPVILNWVQAAIEPEKRHDLSPLRTVFSTGAVLPSQGFAYIHRHVKKDINICSISGGTDIVGCFMGGNPLTPTYAGQIKGPMMGMDVRVWDESGKELPAGETGELVCFNPFPSMPLRFLDDPGSVRYTEEYFSFYPGRRVWRHGDTIKKTPEGQFIIVGRSDATLNQNGVRIGTGTIYGQLASFTDRVKDAAAVDFTRPDNAQPLTVLFLALKKKGLSVPEDLAAAIRRAVRENVGPYSVPTEIMAVPDVLRTPNGKIAEVVMKKLINGKTVSNPSLYGEDLVRHFEKIGKLLAGKYGGL